MKLDNEMIEDIKNKNDIVDVMSKYVSLIKKGKNFTCLCPFHNDTNPSMVVSQDKQIYKCFSCGAGGNVINFVKEYEKISFVEAVQKLGENVGISIELDNKPNKKTTHLQDYIQINDEANHLFQYMLYEYDDKAGYNYLINRNFNEDIIKTFQLGYAYQDDMLLKLLKAKKLNLNKAVEMGLLKLNHDNQYHDVYMKRITYPIIDETNHVVGFSCRTINDSEPKYLNSLESKMFDKASTLYNLNNAVETIKKEKTVYLLEGPNDVIAMYKAGIKNAVCVMGTALTNKHIARLKRLGVNQINLAFDGDEAGTKATIKAINLLASSKITTKVISFDLDDPDEFLNKHGYDKFHERLKQPLSAMQYNIDYQFKKINTNNYDEKKKLVQTIARSINSNLDEFDKEYYFNYLATKSGISFELIKSFSQSSNNQQLSTRVIQRSMPVGQRTKKTNKIKSDVENAMINILYFIMNDKKYYHKFDQEIGSFYDKHYRQLYNVVAAFYLKHELFDISSVDSTLENEHMAELMQILLSYDYHKYNDETVFLDSIATLKLEQYYLEIEKVQDELKQLLDPLQKAQLSTRILEANKAIRQIKNSKFNR